MALDAKTCNIAIGVLGALSLAVGVVVGYLFHKGENETMFIPLAIGFVLVWAAYFFVEKKGEILSGKKVDKY